MLRVGIVANEPSGDMLGAALIREIARLRPDAVFEGVGGPKMIAAGCRSLHPIEKFSVMGLFEVLKHLPELLGLRKSLVEHFRANPPDVFIGVDAPDFNLTLEAKLKQAGIPTLHYVSPTVWAWRPGRVKHIRKAVDRLLCVFPFEAQFLESHGVSARYVGHPLADEIPLENDRDAARASLGIERGQRYVALLPGSRVGEIRSLGKTFVAAAQRCLVQVPDLQFIAPMVNASTRVELESIVASTAPDLPLRIVDGHSREAMLVADAVLTASGTATLEGMLLKRPMVVAYRLSWLTYWIVTTFRMIKIPFIAMANLLAGEEIAPEFVQGAATPQALADALVRLLHSPAEVARIQVVSRRVHEDLRRDAGHQAAEAVLELVAERRGE